MVVSSGSAFGVVVAVSRIMQLRGHACRSIALVIYLLCV